MGGRFDRTCIPGETDPFMSKGKTDYGEAALISRTSLTNKARRLMRVGIRSVFFLCSVGFISCETTYFESEPYARGDEGAANVLVVYYSMTGSTEAMAREIARKYRGDLVRITSADYDTNWGGMTDASIDAWNEKTDARIRPERLDLRGYDLIFLGSPIWWYRPPPPLWAFVGRNQFHGKPVILFNSFNSRFKRKHIERFRQNLKARGGRLHDHIYVRRGRMYDQMSGQDLIRATRDILEKKEKEWAVLIGSG